MSSNLVVVAIPAEDDLVHKLSSEKTPHCTLLFLGETENQTGAELGDIVSFVQHAARIWEQGPFSLEVDHRGELGDDKADVLFFDLEDRWSMKRLIEFRHQLLQHEPLRRAYDSVEQYEFWQPHLTMGYPHTPAREDTRDYPHLSYVHFDRIAVWFGDYEGFEFRLKYHDSYPEVAMSTTANKGAEFVLGHSGVKGMRWGIRKDRHGRDRFDAKGHDQGSDIANVAIGLVVPIVAPLAVPSAVRLIRGDVGAKRAAKSATGVVSRSDKKFEKKAMATKTFVQVHNGAVPGMNKRTAEINKKYPMDLTQPKNLSKKRSYDNEMTKMMAEEYQKSANKLTNKSGTRSYDIEMKNGTDFKIKTKEVKHADEETFEFVLKAVRAPTGQIKNFVWGDSALKQTAELGEAFLMHYGVKGMKWGQRKKRSITTDVSTTTKVGAGFTGKTKVKATGGTAQNATADAVKAAVQKQKLKKSGVAALTNDELRELATRLQLETQVKQLATSGTKKLITQQGKQQVTALLSEQATKQRKKLD